MAKFCRYCGKPIQEGGICNCQGNASNPANVTNPANAVNQGNLGNQQHFNNQPNLHNNANGMNQANYVNQNNHINRPVYNQANGLIENFKGYFNNMKSATIKAVNEKNTTFLISSAALLVVSVIVNFLIMFNKFANDVNGIIKSYSRLIGLDLIELIKYNLESDNLGIVLYGLLFAVSVISILLATVFVLSKIKKSNWSNEGIVYATIINTIPLSCVFLLSGILQLVVSYKILILIHVLYLVTYIITVTIIYNMVTDGFKNLIDVIIYTVFIFIGIILISYVYTDIFSNVIGTFKINGQTIKFYMSLIKKGMAEEFNYMKEDIIEEIFDSIMY